jgi:hypothetical protein
MNAMDSTQEEQIYFNQYFGISEPALKKYGAFNISLVTDLPLFIDPFLLFNSKKHLYQQLHSEIIRYVTFLKDKSLANGIKPGLLKSWFYFSEVKQNWFGYSKNGNKGAGLGKEFANSLNINLHHIFTNFGSESISKSSHLEKLCLIKDGIGRDLISDFSTNLIKGFLLEYTEKFAKDNINENLLKEFMVDKVKFNYETETWEKASFTLPCYKNDYVILTPVDLLTKDEAWINKNDLIRDFSLIANAISNEQLRSEVNNYFAKILPSKPKAKDKTEAISNVVKAYPVFLDYYIKYKENNGEAATQKNRVIVAECEQIYIKNVALLRKLLEKHDKSFFEKSEFHDSYQEALVRINFLKDVIENKDGYKLFYLGKKRVGKEADLQIMFRLVCSGTVFDINREVNNGRGPVDYKISFGVGDSTLVEFKLASNKKLRQNLINQVEVYKAANNTNKAIKVVLYFTDRDFERVNAIIQELELKNGKDIILIDARDNKLSASNV